MSTPFYILSIDGGGFRGLFAAHILKRIEESLTIDWTKHFGLLAGTSTGALLAAGLASGCSAQFLAQCYCRHGNQIFKRRILSFFDRRQLFMSRYSNKVLKDLLIDVFHNKTLGEIDTPLILPAVDIGNGCVHVFKSAFDERFVRDQNVLIADAVLASCSAPTFFDPYFLSNTYQLADGGLWANNPALVATLEARNRLGIPIDEIRVLSVGTGTSKSMYPSSHGKWKDRLLFSWQGWGFATRWESSKLIELILNLQSDNIHNSLCFLLGDNPVSPRRVLRLTFESDEPLPMDCTAKQGDWIARADHVFTHNADKISSFLSLEESK